MEILEKLKYYPKLAGSYISMRFCLWKFAGLSMLLVILAYSSDFLGIREAENLVFVFIMLFIFRWLDDVWSFYIDRIDHPDRTYLKPENFGGMVVMGLIIYVIYQSSLFYVSQKLAFSILSLFLLSNFLYVLFYRNRALMTIIPLLKYPVIIWVLSDFSLEPDVLLLSAGAFMMMLCADLNLENQSPSMRVLLRSFLLLITGLLVVQPWAEVNLIWLELMLVVLPVISLLSRKMIKSGYLIIVIYPIIHLIDTFFQI